MLTIRTLMLLVALVLLLTFTAREAVAADLVLQPANAGDPSLSGRMARSECADLPSRYSIYSEYMEETGSWVTFTEDGPTGVDGGLIHLLSVYRACAS